MTSYRVHHAEGCAYYQKAKPEHVTRKPENVTCARCRHMMGLPLLARQTKPIRYKIKPLVWEPVANAPLYTHLADTGLLVYAIEMDGTHGTVSFSYGNGQDLYLVYRGTIDLEDAKDKADKHYRNKVVKCFLV